MNAPLDTLRSKLRDQLPRLSEQYDLASLELFGSYVRGEQHPDSDLDVLVRFHRAPSLFQLIELESELGDLLGIRVDLVLRDALKPCIGRRILAEATPV